MSAPHFDEWDSIILDFPLEGQALTICQVYQVIKQVVSQNAHEYISIQAEQTLISHGDMFEMLQTSRVQALQNQH